jgi:Lar family restriction alleviation protein
MYELPMLPCPFCGKQFVQCYGTDVPPEVKHKLCRVHCDNCGVSTGNYNTRSEAIAAWNTRRGEAK